MQTRASHRRNATRGPRLNCVSSFADAGGRLEAPDARIAREFPAYAELSNPKPLEIRETQALLAADEAMLVYLVGANETWLWTLRRDRVALHRIASAAKHWRQK